MLAQEITCTDEQEEALAAIVEWFNDPRKQPFFKLFGYAGTGKTTLAAEVVRRLGIEKNTLCAAFTGKAASVIQTKTGLPSFTVHQLTYALAGTDETGRPVFKMRDESYLEDFSVSLLILDECSMVTEKMFDDLRSWGCPILALGDPAQLPPVQGIPFFRRAPDFQLYNVQRQKGDAVELTRYATGIRNFATPLPDGKVVRIIPQKDVTREIFLGADQVLCGLNSTRIAHNTWQRSERGFYKPLPMAGEKLICLQNNKSAKVFNGEQMFCVADAQVSLTDPALMELEIMYQMSGGRTRQIALKALTTGLNNPRYTMNETYRDKTAFDFGYAITVHKSQGSEWDNVVLIDDKLKANDREFRTQWLYTAITRARKTITIIA